MIKLASFSDVALSVLKKLRERTPFQCYDEVPIDAPSPLIFVEVVGKRPTTSKTMNLETFEVSVHAIARPGKARTEIYDMVKFVEEAMTENLCFPCYCKHVLTTESGVKSIRLDSTNEYHAVIDFSVMVSYGMKCK